MYKHSEFVTLRKLECFNVSNTLLKVNKSSAVVSWTKKDISKNSKRSEVHIIYTIFAR